LTARTIARSIPGPEKREAEPAFADATIYVCPPTAKPLPESAVAWPLAAT
jgi:hypothetical protein